jgi:hypothetical protein
MLKKFRIVIPIVALLILAVSTGVILAAGGGPGDAVFADGSAQTIAPQSNMWFRFDYGGARKEVNVTLDANDASALRMKVFYTRSGCELAER